MKLFKSKLNFSFKFNFLNSKINRVVFYFQNPAGQLPNLEFGEDFYSGPLNGGGPQTGLTPPDATILASTIDGTLVAIDQASGEILWELNDQPVVKSPYDSNKPIL